MSEATQNPAPRNRSPRRALASELRAQARRLYEMADAMEADAGDDVEPELVPLDYVVARFNVKTKALRARIHRGELPATKVGKSFLVKLVDVRDVLAPKVVAMKPAKEPQSDDDDETIRGRLRRAGVRA